MSAPESWSSRRVGVLGLGRSGLGAARLLARAGASLYVSDSADDPELRARAAEIREPGVDVDLGVHDPARLAACDLIVVSPGIPPTADVLQAPEVRARPLISELELAFGFLQAPVIGVTGTNGKTTTTAWIGAILERAGLRVGVGGNIGRALSELAMEPTHDWIVAEVSSFQLAHVVRFSPAIGVFLNLSPDHLDRYPSAEAYYADKARFFENAEPSSRWVLNGEDARVRELIGDRPGARRWFRVLDELEDERDGAYLASGRRLVLRREGEEIELLERDELRLLGLHNVANALAASLAATWARVPVPEVRAGLRAFEPPVHRLQPVAEHEGVLWINDSKATNVVSTRMALRAVDRPIVLLLGGHPKGESFVELVEDLRDRVRLVLAYGEAAAQIEEQLGDVVELERVDGPFESVVRRAAERALSGDAVVLAPACASFDMFRDFEERGRRFTELVLGEVTR